MRDIDASRQEDRWIPGDPKDARWILVQRICASAQFQRSPRQRELFTYLSYVAVNEPGENLTEQQVGVAVFGRQPGYDTTSDTIVRVQVSQLRKKLQTYFLTEGHDEPLELELPKGSYLPVFHPREAESVVTEPVEDLMRPPAPPPRASRWNTPLAVAVVLLAAACALLLYQNQTLRSAVRPPAETPAIDTLWGGLFPRGKPVTVVASDANLMMLGDFLGRGVSLSEFRNYTYPRQLTDTIDDPVVRPIAVKLTGTFLTPIQDAAAFGAISMFAGRYGFPVSLVHARDFRYSPENQDGLILLGHTKGNPWGELFQERMNFRYSLGLPARNTAIVNTKPQPGEQPEYQLRSGHSGYSVVAHQPKPSGHGDALLLFGTDMSSLDAATRIVSDEAVLADVLRRLKIAPGSKLPYFEVLARNRLLGSGAPSFEVIAHRVQPR